MPIPLRGPTLYAQGLQRLVEIVVFVILRALQGQLERKAVFGDLVDPHAGGNLHRSRISSARLPCLGRRGQRLLQNVPLPISMVRCAAATLSTLVKSQRLHWNHRRAHGPTLHIDSLTPSAARQRPEGEIVILPADLAQHILHCR